MAHEIDTSNNRANIAYRGQVPWHGLGFAIEDGDDIETIRVKAGLNFNIKKAAIVAQLEDGTLKPAGDLNRSILYRDDTGAPLSVMSTNKYHVVQPTEILDFIDSCAKAMGWQIETAGSLRGGRKIWALAKIGAEADVGKNDRLKGYLLAATACDGSMQSEFLFTSTRVVCNNTLQMALDARPRGGRASRSQERVKVGHCRKVDVAAVKAQLGIAETVWANFIEKAKQLATIKLTDQKAVQILRAVYEPQDDAIDGQAVRVSDEQFLLENAAVRNIMDLYTGQAMGAELKTAKNTAWGLVNATTEFIDHATRSRSVDNRLNSAWFGSGAMKKQEVVDACFKMAA